MGELVKNNTQSVAVKHEEDQFLTFMLASEMFAIDILGIKEIIEYGDITVVPKMPKFVRGVINLRGAVVPVIDLSARFGRPTSPISRRTCIVIVEVDGEGERHDIGAMVDAVSAVLEIPESEIEPPPSFGTKIRPDFISGMGKVKDKFVIILDASKVLSIDEMAMLSEVKDGSDVAALEHHDNEKSGDN